MSNSMLSNAPQRLCQNHGYRFDGDVIHLNAEFAFSDADVAAGESWSLQLWANAAGFPDGTVAGTQVAALNLHASPGLHHATDSCIAILPAGSAPHVMGLALVATGQDGISRVRDLAIYPATETFSLPRFSGEVSCQLANGQADIFAEVMSNPRAPAVMSGTLVLELWALNSPYAGGGWQGVTLASAELGTIAGGSEWINYRIQVPAIMPETGAALTLMLREWTPAGYITRDYRNISVAPTSRVTVETSQALDPVNVTGEANPVVAAVVAPADVVPAFAAHTAAESVPTAKRVKPTPDLKKQIPAKKKKSAKRH